MSKNLLFIFQKIITLPLEINVVPREILQTYMITHKRDTKINQTQV